MPLRYVNYKCITTSLALTSMGTLNLHSSQEEHSRYDMHRIQNTLLEHKELAVM